MPLIPYSGAYRTFDVSVLRCRIVTTAGILEAVRNDYSLAATFITIFSF
jgi:hypothetical protein